MTAPSVRLLAATAIAVTAIALSANNVFAAGDIAACTLTPSEGTSPDNVGTILETVAAPGADDVWAMGNRVSGPASSPWAQHWDGAAWTTAKLDLPQGPLSISAIYDAKAFSGDDVWAVGSWMGEDPFVQHWNGTSWKAVEVPELVGDERILTGIDGTGSNDIWVVGQRHDGGQEHGVVLHFDGTTWAHVAEPPGAAVLHDVAMTGAQPTVVGWTIGAGGFAQAIIATLGTGSAPAGQQGSAVWDFARLDATPNANLFMLGIASASPGGAWAVGFSNDGPNRDTVHTYHRVGDAWQEVPVPDVGGSARLVAVATDAAGTVAVGQVLVGGVNRSLVLRATDTGWEEVPGSGDNAPDTLSGVALQSGDIWAVGRGVVTGATYGVPSARIYACGG
jgi:hypothetical protein